ncbi:TonB-dependent receptor domain-containing protein, partial [Tritonibacter sp. SIMBA_163]|uniref:TonB-dependent receptor domain-containing protein n=1 Tax=Tritonibacter sp. SIMBA_163 TaxID=3080868 RepID=UPI0039807999
IYGNPNLQPETSVNHEVGLLYQGDSGISANVTAFYNDFNDKISRAACPSDICLNGPNQAGADPTYNINIDKAVTQGVEAGVTH